MLKRYVIFAFETYGASGGWADVVTDGMDESGTLLVRSFNTVEEAESVAKSKEEFFDDVEIVDLHTGQVVK